MESSISVAVRVRPFTQTEQTYLQHNPKQQLFLGDGSLASSSTNTATVNPFTSRKGGKSIRKIINVVDDKMLIFDPPESSPVAGMHKAAFPGNTHRIREHRFVFDQLFDEDASQEQVYNQTTRPLLSNIFDGYNATVFAYGATGCGKTHTISGRPEAPGVVFLTMKELFDRIEALRDEKVIDVSLSYLEIYNETIKDLLEPSDKVLTLREDADKKISVSNLSSHKPESVEEVMEMILQGNTNRTQSPTEANATSSRSHAVLQINVIQKNRTAELSESHTFATLSIIDLAGSERASATKNRGERLLEGANINKSLLALGNCINALCDPKRKLHVPYRNSKLTRLLKFSLGGNCKTVMIVCISPSSQHYDETLNTLKYADRAKMIKTKVVRNQHSLDRHVGSYLKMITEQRTEIETLRKREAEAIEQAVAKYVAAEQTRRDAIKEAITSLETTYSRTTSETEQRVMGLHRIKLLTLQQSQLTSWMQLLSGPDFGALTSAYPELLYFVDDAQDRLKRLCSDIEAINAFLDSCTRDMAAQNTVDQCLRRLKELEGWCEADEELFLIWAEQTRDHYEREFHECVSSVSLTDTFFGPIVSQFMNACLHMIQRIEDQEHVRLLSEALVGCENVFKSVSTAPIPTPSTPNFSLPSAYKRSVVVRSPVQPPPKDKPSKRVRWAPSPALSTPRRTSNVLSTPSRLPGPAAAVESPIDHPMDSPDSAPPPLDFSDAVNHSNVSILADGDSRANRVVTPTSGKFGIRGSLRKCVSNHELKSPVRGGNKENHGLGMPQRVTQ
ncbi:P-loop containing nucleoside triphosphate hydrolase protein [Yarrowia lipolytica]|jgi:kinesin family protein 18/19|uniref:Kinesin-like protein n=3 Tax=Yarrowia lipolytica TaxID=4952 RepID=Q6C6P8_YARLI|nr:YALI0E07491p [Yarrowia lipolytica CLIB122]KAB8286108.1 P-loop containing nucleoside triphosphate hydrolase protein [Yarrowia lipolytica]KAE8170126.1 P-loop containing nucleoside triphosphate hydrolase protein [Yarrowia lipolytica]KAJ8056641.1 P-loop containing nucleoside triphosphate hydrolase protein [Yarrowia lipolytica]QNQ00297.1 Kinesin-like protein 6 [Yarrowia lipolytica]RDW27776.1 P-loop containing nucleoside triphosphate hydrolase protein [Yarrowia lipolytica]|eukprot:XP_503664.1 YALI0E07491p [Yarrowia lipolytica CLIB122]